MELSHILSGIYYYPLYLNFTLYNTCYHTFIDAYTLIFFWYRPPTMQPLEGDEVLQRDFQHSLHMQIIKDNTC